MPERPRRRWLRRLVIVASVAVVAAFVGIIVTFQHLDWIARWAIHRVFPGVTAKFADFSVRLPSTLEVRELELRSATSGATLLTLEGGSVVFKLTELWSARIDEVRLIRPDLMISPDLSDALAIGAEPASSAKGSDPFSWAIGTLEIRSGRVRVGQFGEGAPVVSFRITGTLRDFGVGGELGAIEHSASLVEVQAENAKGDAFLSLSTIDIRFTTGELFARDRVRAVHVGDGSLTIDPALIELLQARGRGESEASRKWSAGAVDLDGLDVRVTDSPGMPGEMSFHVNAALREIGGTDSLAGESEQQVEVTKVRVMPEGGDPRPLFRADLAAVRFTIAGLAARTLREVRLKNPAIEVDLGALKTGPVPSPGGAAIGEADEPLSWLIEKVSCDYGELRLNGLRDGSVTASAKFSANLENFGTQGEAGHQPASVTVWDVVADGGGERPFLSLDLARINFTPLGLFSERRIESVELTGGRLSVGKDLRALIGSGESNGAGAPAAPTGASGWTIGEIAIANVRTRIEDDRPGLTELFFTLNTTFNNVSAAGLSQQIADEVQTVEFADIVLRSPLDRSRRIVTLRSVFVRFTLRDLASQHLREIVILRPAIYLNQDLFVYMERATAGGGEGEAEAEPLPGWSVDHLEVKFGRLVIGSGGESDVGLPLEFETTADNLELDNLASLQLQAVLSVPKQSYDFPDYQIEIDDVVGDLRFAYPPEKGEQNLVQKLDIRQVRWRQFGASDAWVAATFDARGINGQFGGAAYEGYVNGGFSFFFQGNSPWIGWVAGTGVDTRELTGILSPQNFTMTGPLDFQVQLDAFKKDIDRVQGDFKVTEPGRLEIGKIDDLLARIPDTWMSIKQDTTRIGLETLRDFDYTDASGKFWFVQSQGILNLDLTGPTGSRIFEVALHDGIPTKSPWQQGTLGRK